MGARSVQTTGAVTLLRSGAWLTLSGRVRPRLGDGMQHVVRRVAGPKGHRRAFCPRLQPLTMNRRAPAERPPGLLHVHVFSAPRHQPQATAQLGPVHGSPAQQRDQGGRTGESSLGRLTGDSPALPHAGRCAPPIPRPSSRPPRRRSPEHRACRAPRIRTRWTDAGGRGPCRA